MTSSPGSADLPIRRLRAALVEVTHALAAAEGRLPGEGTEEAPATGGLDPTLAAVEEISRIPVIGLEVPEVAALAVDRAGRLAGADRVMVLLADQPSGPLVARSARGFRREDVERVVVEAGEGLVGRAFLAGRVATRHADEPDPFVERFPVREAVAVPVHRGDAVAGVLFAGRRGAPAFAAADVLVLAAIAERVGAALAVARLDGRRRGDVERLHGLALLIGESAVDRDVRDALASAAQVGATLLGLSVGLIALAADGEALAVVASQGLPLADAARRDWRRDQGLLGEALVTGEPVLVRDLRTRKDAEALALGEAGVRAAMAVPLKRHGREMVVCLGGPEPRDFTPEDVILARLVAEVVGVAVQNHRAVSDMREATARLGSVQDRVIQAERARALGRMAGGLAQQLSRVFARILGRSQTLRGSVQDDALREGLAELEEAAWDGADVVRRLESLAEPPGDEVEPADLRSLTQEVIAEARSRAEEAPGRGADRLEIVSDLGPTPPVAVPTALLREAVSNLLLNAVDAMAGGGRLTVTTGERDGGAELLVGDTGEGIAEAVQPRIFEPFFTTRSSLRLGLGLTVVHGLVTRAQGRIDVASRPGVGTIVTVWLPAARPMPEPPGGGAARAEGPPAPAAPAARARGGVEAPDAEPRSVDGAGRVAEPRPAPRSRVEPAAILVLEDEEPARASLVEALKAAGYRVVSAADGPTGLAMLHTVRFDLVLADLALPQRSGLAVARSVKRVSPETVVVLMTGWGHLLEPERLREQGVDLMLVKPFRTERLLAVVEEALRLRGGA